MAKAKKTPETGAPEINNGEAGNNGDGLETVEFNAKTGAGYLPGQEPVVVKELVEAVIEYEGVKTERMALTTKEVEAKNEVKRLANKHHEHFREEGEPPNTLLTYTGGGVRVEITHKEEETIKTKLATSEVAASAVVGEY